jgi:Zn-dependent M16 (insulinase) family peptidase
MKRTTWKIYRPLTSCLVLLTLTCSNEMKGVHGSADSLLNRASQRSLFIDNTYNVDSGGDPAVIPDLSFEQFKAFHEKHYHPSNSRIHFAGDDDVYKRLELMDEYLKDFDASEEYKAKSEIQWQMAIEKVYGTHS